MQQHLDLRDQNTWRWGKLVTKNILKHKAMYWERATNLMQSHKTHGGGGGWWSRITSTQANVLNKQQIWRNPWQLRRLVTKNTTFDKQKWVMRDQDMWRWRRLVTNKLPKTQSKATDLKKATIRVIKTHGGGGDGWQNKLTKHKQTYWKGNKFNAKPRYERSKHVVVEAAGDQKCTKHTSQCIEKTTNLTQNRDMRDQDAWWWRWLVTKNVPNTRPTVFEETTNCIQNRDVRDQDTWRRRHLLTKTHPNIRKCIKKSTQWMQNCYMHDQETSLAKPTNLMQNRDMRDWNARRTRRLVTKNAPKQKAM